VGNKKILIYAIAVLVAGYVCWDVFGTVSGYEQRIGELRNDISAVREQQRTVINRLGAIENGLDASADEAGRISEGLGSVAGEIATVEGRVTESQDRARDSTGLIRQGQSILDQIKQRGQE